MVEIIEKDGEVEIFKSYLKHVRFYRIFTLFCILLVSFITLKLIGVFFNLLSIILVIAYIYISFFSVFAEKITIKENYLLIEALRNNKRALYSKKIFLDEINKIYFKETLGIKFFLDVGILNYLINSRQKFIKIETNKKTYSFGLFMEYNDFLKINMILEAKISEEKNRKIILGKVRKKRDDLFNIYNLEVEERYSKMLDIILDEKKLFLCEKENNLFINVENFEGLENIKFEEVNFYIFYVNFLSKKEYESKKILVGFNGIDGKETTILKLKEDINEIRDSQSKFKN